MFILYVYYMFILLLRVDLIETSISASTTPTPQNQNKTEQQPMIIKNLMNSTLTLLKKVDKAIAIKTEDDHVPLSWLFKSKKNQLK